MKRSPKQIEDANSAVRRGARPCALTPANNFRKQRLFDNTKSAVLITGAAKRVGRELAFHLSRKGFDVAIHYNRSKKEAASLAAVLKKEGSDAAIFQADLAVTSQVVRLVPQVFRKFPRLSFLINNASVFDKGNFSETDPKLFDSEWDINFKAPFFLTREFSRHVKKGLVLNFLDTKINPPDFSRFIYTISKKTLATFTEMAAVALAPSIRVNGIAPGALLPPVKAGTKHLPKLVASTPLLRKPQMPDIMAAVDFFLENEFATGQILYVNGGEQLCK